MTKIAANSRACNADVRIIKTIAGFQVVGVPDAPRFKTLVEAKKWCYDKGINPADVKLPQTGGTYVGSAKGSYMNSKACNAKFNVGDRVKVVSGGTLKGKVGRISDGPIYDTLGSFYTVDTHDGRSEDIPEDCIVKASNSAACNADVDYAALGRDLKSAIASAGFKPEFDTECAAIFAFRKDGGEMTQADVQKVKAAVKAVLRKNGSDVNAMRGPDKWIKACWIPFDGEMFIGGPKVALNEDDVVGNSVQITKDSRSTSFWIYGKVGQYTFEAKVYDDPSEYGIDNGRVSKLYMADKDRKCVANYDRGWDVRPKGNEVKAAYKELVAKLNTLPKALNSSVSTNAVVRRAMNAVQTAKPGDYLVFHSRRAGLPGAYYYKALKQNEGDSVLVEDLYGRFTSAPGGKIYDSMKRLEPTTKADASPVRVRINLLPDAYKGDYRAKLNIISSLRGEMESAGYKIINPSGADVGAELPKGELAALKKYCGKYYTVEQI